MKHSYLEVTYRKGRVLAAYYYLPRRDGDKCAQTEPAGSGLLVDFTDDGRPIGVEITSPSTLDIQEFNQLLLRLGQEPIQSEELGPFRAA